MRKDITKKFLMREDRFVKKMLSKDVVDFIFSKKINRDEKQISYDVIDFVNVFSTEFTNLNTKNILESGDKFKEVVLKNGKSIELNMIYCKYGEFEMGSNDPEDENPKEQVEIERSFLLGEIEITQELYKLVMGNNPSICNVWDDGNSSQRPVENVTWYDALLFCNKLSELQGKKPYYEIDSSTLLFTTLEKHFVQTNGNANGFRLPYEKEWEYAAKAGTNNKYAGTNDERNLGEYAWFSENSKINPNDKEGRTHPVKTKKPNEWGFYDMSGNVFEWCGDRYSCWPNVICRGGAWLTDASFLRTTRDGIKIEPNLHTIYIGFRIAISI